VLLTLKGYFRRERGFDFADIHKPAFTWILLIEAVALVTWQMFANNRWVLLLVVTTHLLALWILFYSVSASTIVWFLGMSLTILLSAQIYDQPAASLALCFMPLISILLQGWMVGLLIAGLTLGEVLIAPDTLPILTGYRPHILIGAGAGWVVGGIIRYSLVNFVETIYANYQHAIGDLAEARLQRAELKQVQDDLVHANRELTRLTRQLRIANHAAEEARRVKDNFVSTVSHELRTPLNMIIGFSEVIAKSPRVYKTRLPPTLLADITSIQRNSQHLLALINDVLDLSQVEMGVLSLARDWCSLQALIQEAVDVIHPLFHSKGLYLKIEAIISDDRIYCDQTRIREVLINLLSNAGRFTERGGVTIRTKKDDKFIIFSIEDSGPGIPSENQARIFEPFYQQNSSIYRKKGGSGLGLSISKRLVELHGGEMWFESQLGIGSIFSFSLPLDVLEDDAPNPSNAFRWVNPYATKETRTRPFLAPVAEPTPRCVLLEQGDGLRRLFERYLDGVEIIPVRDGSQAALEVGKPLTQALVINHPQYEEISKKLLLENQLSYGQSVIGFWLPGTESVASSMHVNRYLVKPVSTEILLETLEQFGDDVQNILLVDDNPDVLQLFGRIITSSDRPYKILRATNGLQALDLMRMRKPDLVFLDLVMPEVDGFQVLNEKENNPDICKIPVVVLTAQDPAISAKVVETVKLGRGGGIAARDLLKLVKLISFHRME
jgi:signal transduction histidine kinase/CheY-like chemotaxis protein